MVHWTDFHSFIWNCSEWHIIDMSESSLMFQPVIPSFSSQLSWEGYLVTEALDIDHQSWFRRCSWFGGQCPSSPVAYEGDLLLKLWRMRTTHFFRGSWVWCSLSRITKQISSSRKPFQIKLLHFPIKNHLKWYLLLWDCTFLNGRACITNSSHLWTFFDSLLCMRPYAEYFPATC